jgi:hypothetical protein
MPVTCACSLVKAAVGCPRAVRVSVGAIGRSSCRLLAGRSPVCLIGEMRHLFAPISSILVECNSEIQFAYLPKVPPPGGVWGQSPCPHTPLAKSRWQEGLCSAKVYQGQLHGNMESLMSRVGDFKLRSPLEGNVAYVDDVPVEQLAGAALLGQPLRVQS